MGDPTPPLDLEGGALDRGTVVLHPEREVQVPLFLRALRGLGLASAAKLPSPKPASATPANRAERKAAGRGAAGARNGNRDNRALRNRSKSARTLEAVGKDGSVHDSEARDTVADAPDVSSADESLTMQMQLKALELIEADISQKKQDLMQKLGVVGKELADAAVAGVPAHVPRVQTHRVSYRPVS